MQQRSDAPLVGSLTAGEVYDLCDAFLRYDPEPLLDERCLVADPKKRRYLVHLEGDEEQRVAGIGLCGRFAEVMTNERVAATCPLCLHKTSEVAQREDPAR